MAVFTDHEGENQLNPSLGHRIARDIVGQRFERFVEFIEEETDLGEIRFGSRGRAETLHSRVDIEVADGADDRG
jgi:hypothetical protein